MPDHDPAVVGHGPPGRCGDHGVRRPFATAVLLACAIPAFAAAAGSEAERTLTEFDVKAAYLYNFARFVEWPAQAGAGAGVAPPFVVAVLGDDPFGSTLDETLAGKAIGERPFVVRRVSTPEAAAGAQIVFVSASERSRLPHVLRVLEQAGALTVSDLPGFAERGGMIGFRKEGRKVRFDINPGSAERAGLTLSSQLLKLARIVAPESGR
jgi:hypothetical protein